MSAGMFVDWEQVTGQSKLVIELVTIPIFSAVAGLITNWTGVWMLFAPVTFVGFRIPGLQTIYPLLPRRVQVLPIFAEGSKFGFQGFIPARTEKMASLTVDKAIAKIGGPADFYRQLEPEAIAAQFADVLATDLRPTIDFVMEQAYPQLWNDLPPQWREMLYARVADELPTIADRSFAAIGEHIDELMNVKTMIIDYLRERPEMMKDIIYNLGGPELRFMVWSGLLGFPFGLVLAVYLQLHHAMPFIGHIPVAVMVLLGTAAIGVAVNIIAVRVVFTPAVAKPRYLCLWRQALFAKRQDEAATQLGHAIAHQIVTMETIVNHLVNGPNADKTRRVIHCALTEEIDRILGRMKPMVKVAVGGRRLTAIHAGSTTSAIALVPTLADNLDFSRTQADKIDRLCAQKLRDLPPSEFVELLYCAVEQDAWLLYLHGGVLGFVVGLTHLVIFGA
jgi:hypothetical protein